MSLTWAQMTQRPQRSNSRLVRAALSYSSSSERTKLTGSALKPSAGEPTASRTSRTRSGVSSGETAAPSIAYGTPSCSPALTTTPGLIGGGFYHPRPLLPRRGDAGRGSDRQRQLLELGLGLGQPRGHLGVLALGLDPGRALEGAERLLECLAALLELLDLLLERQDALVLLDLLLLGLLALLEAGVV